MSAACCKCCTGISVGRGVMCGVWSDASLYHSTGLAPAKHIVHAVIFGELESYLNNYILMATSMKCDNILIMNNSCNWFGRTQEDTRLHPAIIIMHTGVSLTNNILVFRFRCNVGLSTTPQQQRQSGEERREADCLSFKTYIHTSCSNASILSYPSYSWFQFTEN